MTIWNVLDLAGGVAGLAVLVVMALVPALLALPLPRREPAGTRAAIPAQRTGSPVLHVHTAA